MSNANKQSRRTADELIADKMAEIARLQARMVIESAQDNSILEPINEIIAISRDKYTKASHNFSSGAQSYENRLLAYCLKTNEIESERDLQSAIREYNRARKDFFVNVRQEASEMIVAGKTDDEITIFINEKQVEFDETNSSDFSELEDIWEQSREARIKFIATRSK